MIKEVKKTKSLPRRLMSPGSMSISASLSDGKVRRANPESEPCGRCAWWTGVDSAEEWHPSSKSGFSSFAKNCEKKKIMQFLCKPENR